MRYVHFTRIPVVTSHKNNFALLCTTACVAKTANINNSISEFLTLEEMFCLANPMKLTWLKTLHPPSQRISSVLRWNISITLGGVARWVLPMFQQLIIHMIESIITIDDVVPLFLNPNRVFQLRSCSFHIVHGAFSTGIHKAGWDFLLAMHGNLFEDSPASRANFIEFTKTDAFGLQCSSTFTRCIEHLT